MKKDSDPGLAWPGVAGRGVEREMCMKRASIFLFYDKDGVAVINAAQENGIKIPDEMEVVGMLNTSYSIMCKPTLSSMNVPVYDMGALAVRLLTKFLQDEEIESKEIAVQHMFIKRDSTKDD